MADRDTFFQKLLDRRVPQILGVYIAAAWVTVEMGEWLTDLLDWPGRLVVYVFVLLAIMLPSVIMLAWNHGAPGPDRWPRSEKIWLPINSMLALAVVAAMVVSAPVSDPDPTSVQVDSPVTQRTLVDETGTEQVFEVAREGFHKRIAAFFWAPAQEASLARDHWQGYAIAWLLAVDLGRDPLLTMFTPYSRDLIEDLKSSGFERAVGEPLSLSLRLARQNDAELLIRGEYEPVPAGIRLSATIANARNGRIVAEHQVEGENLVAAVAGLSDAMAPELYGDIERDPAAFVDIQLDEASTGSPEALQALIEGANSHNLDHDADAAIASLQRAVELDPEFALAHAQLSNLHRGQGNLQASARAIDRALALDYKLDSETIFGLKANRYAVMGDYDKAVRVLQMWTEVHPDSFSAQFTLANNMIALGRVEEARTALDQAGNLDPDNADINRLLFSVEKLSGNLDAASERLQAYIESEPRDADARIDLGNLYLLRGQFDLAREALEQAQVVASNPFRAELDLVTVEARSGRLDEALADLDTAIEGTRRSDNLGRLLMARYIALSMAGRFNEVIAMVEERGATLQEAYPAANYWMLVAEMLGTAHSELGQLDQALEALDAAEAQLGEPVARYLSINRLQILSRHGGDLAEMELALERLRFFEKNFAFTGTQAYVELAEALLAERRGNTSEAVDRMRRAMEATRASVLALDLFALDSFEYQLGRLLLVDGQIEEARSVLTRIVHRHPAHGMTRLELARLEAADDQPARAREHLEYLLSQWHAADPEYGAYTQAQALLDSLPGTD